MSGRHTLKQRQATALIIKGRGILNSVRPLSGIPIPPAKQCQWIDGEPSADDGCKCLAPTTFFLDKRVPYCAEHAQRAYRKEK